MDQNIDINEKDLEELSGLNRMRKAKSFRPTNTGKNEERKMKKTQSQISDEV